MSDPKRQHWLPKFYLRSFAIEGTANRANPQVWILPRDRGEPHSTGISNVAVERYIYSPPRADGQRDGYVERRLADLESTLSSFWESLATDFIAFHTIAKRRAIALFMATLVLRNPAMRKLTADSHSKLARALEESAGHSVQVSGEAIQPDREAIRRLEDPSEQNRAFVNSILRDARWLAEILLQKRWAMATSDRPVWATSDCPVYVASQEHARHQLGGKDATIMFPVSPIRILVLDDRQAPDGRYHKVPAERQADFNLITWANAQRFLISFDEPESVLRSIVKTYHS